MTGGAAWTWKENGVAVVNLDDSYGQRLIDSQSNPCVSFGLQTGAQVTSKRFVGDLDGLDIAMHLEQAKLDFHVPFPGRFNLSNVLAASAAAHALSLPLEAIREGLEAVEPVPGRVERLDVAGPCPIYIDFAHTPGALSELLALFQGTTRGRVILVFGCGGERDKKKRPQMGQIAARGSEIPIVTSDNPRGENPEAILVDILGGLEAALASGQTHYAIVDRKEAIQKAIQIARQDDVLLIAGKGHEPYQIVGEERVPFYDGTIVQEILRTHGG